MSEPSESGRGLPAGPAWNVMWSYAILRFTLGTTFLFHGIARFVSGWSAYADQLVQSFTTPRCRTSWCGPLA